MSTSADVLIIRLSALGDIVHCLPAAQRIRERLGGGSRLVWMVEPAGESLLRGNPVVDDVIVLPRKAWLKSLSSPSRWLGTITEVASFWRQVQRRDFAAAIDFQGLLKSATSAKLSGAPRVFGFDAAREGARFLLTDAFPVGDYYGAQDHVVELNLRLADFACDKLGLKQSTSSDVQFTLPTVSGLADARIENRLVSEPLAVVVPGTTWDTKIWPPAYWSKLIEMLLEQTRYTVLMIGGPGERDINQGIEKSITGSTHLGRFQNLTGSTTLRDLIWVFNHSDLVIGGDTGPLHLAAATGKPQIIGVYGSTPINRNGPYGYLDAVVSAGLDCQPCFQKQCPLQTVACLRDLPPERVMDQVNRLKRLG